jgi:hypothetical protein
MAQIRNVKKKGGERMTEHFILTFSTNTGRTKQVRFPEPDRSISISNVISAANRVIASDIFNLENDGSLVALKKAELQTVTRTELL